MGGTEGRSESSGPALKRKEGRGKKLKHEQLGIREEGKRKRSLEQRDKGCMEGEVKQFERRRETRIRFTEKQL